MCGLASAGPRIASSRVSRSREQPPYSSWLSVGRTPNQKAERLLIQLGRSTYDHSSCAMPLDPCGSSPVCVPFSLLRRGESQSGVFCGKIGEDYLTMRYYLATEQIVSEWIYLSQPVWCSARERCALPSQHFASHFEEVVMYNNGKVTA